jgi:hypothetical protein
MFHIQKSLTNSQVLGLQLLKVGGICDRNQ